MIFLLLATIMVTMQDLVGVGMAGIFGLDGRMGLCMGSVPWWAVTAPPPPSVIPSRRPVWKAP